MPDVTTWEISELAAPSDSGYYYYSPDIMREKHLDRIIPKAGYISQYNSTDFNPLRNVDNWHRDPKTFDMMTWMSETFINLLVRLFCKWSVLRAKPLYYVLPHRFFFLRLIAVIT